MKYEVKTKKLAKSQVEIEAILPAELLAETRKRALKQFSENMELPGFRKGRVPESMVIEKVGEAKLLEEAVDILLKEHFHKIIEQEKFDIIGPPKVSITKLALGNPVEFKAVFSVMPEIELPDYKKIASEARSTSNEKREEKETEVTDKEVDDVLLQIRKNKVHLDWHHAHPEEKTHNHPEIKDEDLPRLDDEFAKSAGNFKNLDELKAKVKENIVSEKKIKETEKKRAVIMEELVKKSKMDLPEILVESEINKSIAQMKDDIERMGVKFEEYLKQVKKTEEELKKDVRESSEKRAKIQLIFNKIAETEKLEPNKEILENEVKELRRHYPDASETNLRVYVATILLNSEVLKLLENQ